MTKNYTKYIIFQIRIIPSLKTAFMFYSTDIVYFINTEPSRFSKELFNTNKF